MRVISIFKLSIYKHYFMYGVKKCVFLFYTPSNSIQIVLKLTEETHSLLQLYNVENITHKGDKKEIYGAISGYQKYYGLRIAGSH